ncbi:beta strand repeat-containing protein, partial [Candidatus Laterigemmans baculatus]|uniref:beta strand repeat-containing protein n=1 Tax=Candidatus Laterigemmans baculatus TaxID=2770505 RepID=UPI0013D9E64C
AGGRFAIDANTGVVTLAAGLDYETSTSHSVTIRATSTDGSSTTQNFTINVNDVDEFDATPVIDSNAAANEIDEDAVIGSAVGITASSDDADGTDSVSYSLDDDAGGRFAIDANTGVVTLAAGLDYETSTSHSVTVRATSTDGSSTTQNFTINVNDVDEFDATPVVDANAAANEIDEDAVIGSTVGITASSNDADGTDSVSYSLDDDAGGRFAIDANTGVVTLAAGLDYESNTSHTVTVRATSTDGSSTTQNFTINVNDIDEFDATPVIDTNAAANEIDEDAVIGSAVGITASSDDADGTDSVSYSLDDDAGGRFAIDANTGVVTLAAGLDYETSTSHSVTVRATSTDGSSTTQNFTINVNDVDEFDATPVVDANAAANEIDEDAVIGSAVGITASSDDADGTDSVSYSLDDDAGGRFAIDANTGVVTLAAGLDYETSTSHSVTVRATSTDGSSTTQNFTINVNDVDEFDATPVVDTNAAANEIDEDAVIGSAVGITASSDDADGTDSVSYSLDDDAGGRFAIDANTGVVTLAAGLDYETSTSHTVTVRATSTDGSSTTQNFTINVNDIDEFDATPVVDTNAAANEIDEDAVIGSAVGITASSDDADGTDSVSYSLDDDAGGRFAIDANTGVVTLAAGLDYETSTSHSVTVRATSTDGSSTTQSFTINVNDVDEFDATPVVDANAAANEIDEDAVIGSAVGITASSDDADGTDSVSYSLDDDAGGRFAIDANTGVVTLAAGLDYEANTSHSVTVRATSTDGSSTTQSFTINVNDVDEFDATPVVDANAAANEIDEDAVIGSTVGITASSDDADGTDSVSYSLDDDAGGRFAIDANTGVVTLAAGLDYETSTSHSVTVRATSTDGSSTTQSFTINVNDIDEFDATPVIDANAAANEIDEDAMIGSAVGITASSDDADGTDSVSYSLDDDAGGRFAIDANTGVVTLAAGLDYETSTSHSVTVRATSTDGSSTTQSFTINVNDVDEFDATPVVDTNAAANEIDEDAVIGSAVGITASSDDADGTDSVSYSLDDDAGGRFAIDANTGVVTLAAGLDYETSTSHSVTVRATSTDGSSTTQSFTINVNDVDEFDATPVVDTNAAANEIDEDAVIGSAVGITASSDDADGTDSVSYSLDDDAGGRFAIDANTGVVTLAAGLDYETSTSHSVTVRATSTDGSSTTQSFTINVNDVDEFDATPVVDTNAAANEIDEDAVIGSAVGITASSDDADGTDSVSYSLDDDAGGRFAIDANTGVVTLAAGLDYETSTSHSVTVRATSTDGSSTTQSFTINVNDVDEFDATPVVDANAAANEIDEDAVIGSAVGITASSDDADGTDSVSYSLDDDAGGRFAI